MVVLSYIQMYHIIYKCTIYIFQKRIFFVEHNEVMVVIKFIKYNFINFKRENHISFGIFKRTINTPYAEVNKCLKFCPETLRNPRIFSLFFLFIFLLINLQGVLIDPFSQIGIGIFWQHSQHRQVWWTLQDLCYHFILFFIF